MRQQSAVNNHVSSIEEQVSVAEAAAAVAHAASVPGIPLQQVHAKAKDLANLLDEHKDEQVLKESCLDLCQLFGEGIQNDRIQSILEAAVVPKLVHLLEPIEKRNGVFEFRVPVSVQSAALQVIGNIACGDDRQTQVIIDCNVLPCLRALLTCEERGIRKECCWIISNISESAHQVQDVIDAEILPFLLRLLESQDAACREDATWVLYNVTANRDEKQIDYLCEQGCVRALCSLLSCTKELDVNWKGCGTIAEVALKGLRNVLAVGESKARRMESRLNRYAAVVVNSYGVERIEALTHHRNVDIRARARALLNSFFGAESVNSDFTQSIRDPVSSPSGDSSSSAESEPEDEEDDEDDSIFELSGTAAERCACPACSDLSRLPETRVTRGTDDLDICECCGGVDVVGKTRTVLSIKIGRAVRLGHRHCLAVLLSRMTWSQRGAAIEAPSGINSNLLPPEAALTSSLPAFVLAAQGGKADCLELIVRKCQPDLDMTYGKKRLTALAWAAHKGNFRCCKILRENGASVNTRCADGVTALHLAASAGAHSVCKLLIEHGALVDAKSSKKQTPLCLAAQRGHAQVVKLLLSEGAATNQEDDQSLTALHLAALNGHDEVVSLLIDGGADVNAENVTGTTPVCYAVQRRHAKCVRVLINGGAKLCVPGSSPLLFIAADEGDVECVKALLDANTKLDCRANIKVLINKDYEMIDSLSPLHLAASKGHDGVVELLLDRGVDVDERSSKGWSALDFAVLNGHVSSASTLIFYGAVVDDGPKVIGRGSWTLVQHAAHSGNKDIVRLLIQRLQEQKVQGVKGETPTNGLHLGDRTTGYEPAVISTAVEKKKIKYRVDDDRDSYRNRDLRRWELEAADARDRLEEAVSLRSVSKIKEASAFANKVLLHMAAGTGEDDSVSSTDTTAQQTVQSISIVLSNEIERSRKVLTEVQLQERRKKEKRDADAANLRRRNARRMINDCVDAVRGGADIRVLQRSLKKAQNALEPDDDSILEARELSNRILRGQEIDRRLAAALAEDNVEEVEAAVSALEAEHAWHVEHQSTGALAKVVGRDIESRLDSARERVQALTSEREAIRAAAELQKKAEQDALQRLERAAEGHVLVEIERCLQEIVDFSSLTESARSAVSAIRKNFQRTVKQERRKLRLACASDSIEAIGKALEEAHRINLRALESEVVSAESALERLRERDRVVSEFATASARRDAAALQGIRVRFEELGMVAKAEEARLLIEVLHKEERARTQLQAAVDAGAEVLPRMRQHKFSWPDGRRLADLIKRGRQFDSALLLVTEAEALARELASAGVALLVHASASGEARTVAAAIESYERAFGADGEPDSALEVFDALPRSEAVSEARARLASIQHEERERAIAEAEEHTAAIRAAVEVRDAGKDNRRPAPASTSAAAVEPVPAVGVDTAVPSPERTAHPRPRPATPEPAVVTERRKADSDPFLEDDASSERDASDNIVCVHYYLLRGGNSVVCSKCGHERSSTNSEWLNRVRRRTQKNMETMDEMAMGVRVPSYYGEEQPYPHSSLHRMVPAEPPLPTPLGPVMVNTALGMRPVLRDHFEQARGAPVWDDSTADISAEFAMQNFGFDIDAIVNDS